MPPQNTSDQNQTNRGAPTSPWVIPFSIIVAGALIGGGIYLSGGTAPKTLANKVSSVVDTVNIREISAEDHILGNPNAPVVIVEYSDPECPFCKQFHNTMHRIINEYGAEGKVAWVYRHFPIDSLHAKARSEAEASECAAIVGGNQKFWEYTDQVYSRTNSNDSLDPKELPKIASDIGLNLDKFNSCVSNGDGANAVTRDIADALGSGGLGTPHSILIAANGEKITIKGAQAYDFIKTIVDAALAQ